MNKKLRMKAILGITVIAAMIGGISVLYSNQTNRTNQPKEETAVIERLAFDDSAIRIQPADGYDGFEGWGTSLAWWAHVLGQWSNQDKLNEVLDLVFDEPSGLGLNIVRYNIGGGENPTIDPNSLRPGGDVPGFQPEEGKWDWEADAGQRKVMTEAFKRGATIAEAFSNSPPYWMTVSGSVTGAEDGGNNLKEQYYDAFADYLTEVVRQYKERYGIAFRSLNPLNEPASNWWKRGNIQEGAHFSPDKQSEILKKTAASLRLKGLTDTVVSAPDENSVDETVEALQAYDEETLRAISQINTHSYNGSQLIELRELAVRQGKKLWMSEYGTGGSEPHNHDDMTSVMELAGKIIVDLRLLQPSAWIYWQAIEDESAKNNWGFIHSDFSVDGDYELTKQYYGMAQFSKFIRPGSRIIPTSDGYSIAAYDPSRHQLTIVLRNEWAGKEYAFDLSSFAYETEFAVAYVTSMLKSLQSEQVPLFGNGLKIKADPQSVTTIVISDIKIIP